MVTSPVDSDVDGSLIVTGGRVSGGRVTGESVTDGMVTDGMVTGDGSDWGRATDGAGSVGGLTGGAGADGSAGETTLPVAKAPPDEEGVATVPPGWPTCPPALAGSPDPSDAAPNGALPAGPPPTTPVPAGRPFPGRIEPAGRGALLDDAGTAAPPVPAGAVAGVTGSG